MTPSPWDALVVIATAVAYGAMLGAAGGVSFLAYSRALVAESEDERIRRWIRMLLIVSALASGAKILAAAASMSGDLAGMFDRSLTGMVLQAGEGRAVVVRLLGLALMTFAVSARRRPVAALVGAVVAATSFAWVGHVHALTARLPTLVLAVHLLGAAFWLGALVPLLIVTGAADIRRVAAAAARFGTCALYVVGALLTAGICLLWTLLGDVTELWTDSYGRLVMIKMAFVAVLLALAALNHLRLTPRLRAQDARAARTLGSSIRFEIAVAAVVLIVTAALTTLTGPEALA